jgi:CubicO group peptidase (beta-lactamase class C family)
MICSSRSPWLKKLFTASLIAIATSTSAFAADIQPGNCARAANYSERQRGYSMLVIQNGKTVFEHYGNGGIPNGRWPIFSGTKNFWGIAALVGVSEGLFRLDDRVADTIAEWKNDPRKSAITVRELLSQTDGLEPAPFLHRQSIGDRDAMAIHLPSVGARGSVFTYGPSHLQVFVELLRRKLKDGSPISFLETRVLNPLGIYSVEYKKDALGRPLPASGFELTAQEWSRLGALVVGQGNYQGHQIVSASLLREAFVGTAANPSYGLTFWLNREAAHAPEIDFEKMLDLPWQRERWFNVCVCRAAPPDMVVAIGSNRQRMFMIPSMNAVIVRQGADSKFSDSYFLRLVLGR